MGFGIGIANGNAGESQYNASHSQPSPGSPPGMTASKSSKSSSLRSLNSDDGSVLADVGHFEDIGLDDHNITFKAPSHISVRPAPLGRTLASAKRTPRPQRSFPNLQSNAYVANPRSASLTTLPNPRSNATLAKAHSTTSVPLSRRHRSTSPGISLNPRGPNLPVRPRRCSWQVNRDRKSLSELEHECDEEDEDNIPDGLVLDNVPISPRPAHERPPSRAPSVSLSPNRGPKERVRSIGNGTPPVAQAHGSLRSPPWRNSGSENQPLHSLVRSRTQSWNAALADLSAETKALTEKLEEHADEVVDREARRPAAGLARPNTWNPNQPSLGDGSYEAKGRVKSSLPELPPLRRTDIMIDPLPISKEKEAILSHTRPSWLPPKDPAEERRHLRQYQRMVTASIKADERREAARRTKTETRDNTVDRLLRIWEDDIIPRWNEALCERRTRDMWWKGVPPRSRRVVWAKAIGNGLGLSDASFHAALARSEELESRVKADRCNAEDMRRVKWFEQIRKDAGERTWKELRIFEVAGPLHQGLVDVLRAYAMYRNDIGYVSGCNTIAGLLLLNLPNPETTFIALANVLNRPLPLSFHTFDPGAQASAFNIVLQTLRLKSNALYEHLTKTLQDIEPEMYLGSLFMSIFTEQLAIDAAARLWDVYVFEGDTVLVRAAVAILLSREMDLLGSRTADEVKETLSKAGAGTSPTHSFGQGDTEDSFMQSIHEMGKI